MKNVNEENKFSLIKKRVIVRSRNAGVMYGTLESFQGQTVYLTDARILWQWGVKGKKGLALNSVALYGLDDDNYTKISPFNKKLIMLEACSIIEVSECARKNIDEFKSYVP